MPRLPALNANEYGTLNLALSGWAARCTAEEKAMRDMARDFADKPDLAAKCIRNAEASAIFAREARAVLAKL